jgi:hypothetical protein
MQKLKHQKVKMQQTTTNHTLVKVGNLFIFEKKQKFGREICQTFF